MVCKKVVACAVLTLVMLIQPLTVSARVASVISDYPVSTLAVSSYDDWLSYPTDIPASWIGIAKYEPLTVTYYEDYLSTGKPNYQTSGPVDISAYKDYKYVGIMAEFIFYNSDCFSTQAVFEGESGTYPSRSYLRLKGYSNSSAKTSVYSGIVYENDYVMGEPVKLYLYFDPSQISEDYITSGNYGSNSSNILVIDLPSENMMPGDFTLVSMELFGSDSIDESNELPPESTTEEKILSEIQGFFGSFFDKLGDLLLGLIVPDSGELTAFLDEVNAWFGERLGFLWYPFSFALDAVSMLSAGEADTMFTVPALEMEFFGEKYTIWNEIQVDMDAFDIFKYVRMLTSAILVCGIVSMAISKWDEWIGGHDS